MYDFLEKRGRRIERTIQVVAWLLLLSIAMLSVVPPTHRPVTGTSQSFEHVSIFLAAGTAFALGYRHRFWLLAGALVAFSLAIELVQLGVPGRHARLSDFLVDATASCIGVALGLFVRRRVVAYRPIAPPMAAVDLHEPGVAAVEQHVIRRRPSHGQ
jgi:VanZ family protein